ncbi:Glu-tRNA(Gln) amidotransferase GatDE subunit D [Candidatus Woesearchaeota archaeon]|nr:MAG: Glu-tRNA(Gln) amidotransferase GatDE subunit D [Candidatus Woesearchaeota archaeon]
MGFVKGERLSFSYQGQRLEGIVITAGDRLTIKLDSGYNITVKPGELSHVKHISVPVKKQAKRHPPKTRTGLPTISILHTGGTIASRVDYTTGAVIAQFTAEDLLELFPEILSLANIRSRLVGNMQSEMMRFPHWNILARAVEEEVKAGATGVIITHGTDILHMTSAALAFALENLQIPVLLVGSQRSSDRPSSDAASNLLCATAFIAQEHEHFHGVGICMHESIENDACVILPACRSRKMHTSRRDAFRPINDAPLARISYPGLEVERLADYPTSQGPLVVRPFNEQLKIGLCTLHPHFFAHELLAYEKFDGLVLALFGIGHAPTMATDEHNSEHEKVLRAIKRLAKRMPVVGASQTLYGRLNMNVYSPGRQLIAAGVLGQGLDITPETAFVKLAWLLSNHPADLARLYGQNLRGECSSRSTPEGFP